MLISGTRVSIITSVTRHKIPHIYNVSPDYLAEVDGGCGPACSGLHAAGSLLTDSPAGCRRRGVRCPCTFTQGRWNRVAVEHSVGSSWPAEQQAGQGAQGQAAIQHGVD